VPDFVCADGGEVAVFTDIKAAEAKARESLFNALNANLRDRWRELVPVV
jgi:hypothetical protein